MPRAEAGTVRFVRALLPAHRARAEVGVYTVERRDLVARLHRDRAVQLAAEGVLTLTEHVCVAGPRARAWLTAQRAPTPRTDANEHVAPAAMVSLEESPLARLAAAREGEAPFLLAHQVAAGERVRRLVERARLRQHMTMSYDATRTASGGGSIGPADISDNAMDARRKLDEIAALLPPDCRGVVFDVCGLLKGLQVVETERGWPRRSAKMVLRIGLEQLAAHWGLSSVATGRDTGRMDGWLEQRLPLIGE